MSFSEPCSNWNVKKLVDVTEYISRGITPKYTESTENSVVVINQRCIRDGKVLFENSRRHSLKKKSINEDKYLKDYDVLVNSTGVGTLGRVSQIHEINELTTTDSHVTIVRSNENVVDKRFLGYSIKSKQWLIENMAEGSTGQTELSRIRFGEEIEIEFPESLAEQKAIAHILSSLDEKIEVNNKINKTLEEMGQSIFKHWFVDFEFPNEDGEPYKSSGGEMVDSELGLIPKGWEVKTLGDLSSEIITGKTPSTKDKSNFDGKIQFVKIPDMHGKVFITKTESYLSEKGMNINKVIPPNSIMVSCIATPGLVSLAAEECQTNQQINTIVNINPKMSYFTYFLISDLADYIRTLGSTGSTTLNLNKGQFSKIKVIKPKGKYIYEFYDLVDPIFNKILTNQRMVERLDSIRDTLIPKLMSGEIRVPLDIEEQ
ncbi:restriction endonuclease subunit S [Gudongella sp. DL1XJH-153]|uniref:restriction endonuclease subunit S n=1 Tax=Gudongella sp. DL1XJH-153 TaxID=3409804 RepID=UPI003BB80F2B